MIAFPYFGGKSGHAQALLSLFPEQAYRGHYVEPFAGSAAILLAKEPSQLETINDLDNDVVNFFWVLREKPKEFLRLLQLTPWSREEFNQARTPAKRLSKLEKARRFYTRVRQGFNALPRMRSNGWKYSICPELRSQNPPETWQAHLADLERVAQRLAYVQIENRPALKILESYDRKNTFFYIDPPYVLSTRSRASSHNQNLAYVHEMEDRDHEELAEVLNGLTASVMISGYQGPLYNKLFSDWRRVDLPSRVISSSKVSRTESVWLNYDPPAQQLALNLEGTELA